MDQDEYDMEINKLNDDAMENAYTKAQTRGYTTMTIQRIVRASADRTINVPKTPRYVKPNGEPKYMTVTAEFDDQVAEYMARNDIPSRYAFMRLATLTDQECELYRNVVCILNHKHFARLQIQIFNKIIRCLKHTPGATVYYRPENMVGKFYPPKMVERIMRLARNGDKMRTIANEFSLSNRAVEGIIRRHSRRLNKTEIKMLNALRAQGMARREIRTQMCITNIEYVEALKS